MLSRLVGKTRKLAPKNIRRTQLIVEALEHRLVPSTAYLATDLVSDQAGVAAITDPNLVNAWGIALNPNGNGAFWVSSNGKDLSTVYNGDTTGHPFAKSSLEVSIPGGAPTGQVFNPTSDFTVTNGSASGPAVFIFASESGQVTGWNPNVPPPAPSTSAQPTAFSDPTAVLKGIALSTSTTGNFLYLADFANNKIDVLDGGFHLVTEPAGAFTDSTLPAGYAPFNVAVFGDKLYVTYAKQDAAKKDDVAGAGHGFVDVYNLDGTLQTHLISGGALNSPWGMAMAPADFGDFSNMLLVGNFGDGRINAFDPATGAFKGTLSSSPGHPLVIDGLWGITFGNGVAGTTNTLYYAAGPADESHGLFGKITANAAGTSPVQVALIDGNLTITGSRDNDQIEVELVKHGQTIVVESHEKTIGSFNAADVSTITVNGLAGNDSIEISPRIDANAILDGGAGNDHLVAGGGNDILLGGSGNDVLVGRFGRDILIGGEGRDVLVGGKGSDLLIGGSTKYDADTASLLKIMTEWASTDSFTTRMAKLTDPTSGLPILDSTTVIDDGERDQLVGGPGLDWFFAGTGDHIAGKGHDDHDQHDHDDHGHDHDDHGHGHDDHGHGHGHD